MTRFRHAEWSSPLMSRKVSGFILFVIATSVLATLIAVISFIEISRKDRASGYLVPASGRWTQVISDASHGVVDFLPLRSGDAVEKGDTLVVIQINSGLGDGETIADRRLTYLGELGIRHHDQLTMYHKLTQIQQSRNQLHQELQSLSRSYLTTNLESERRLLEIAQERHRSIERLHSVGVATASALRDSERQVELRQIDMSNAERALLESRNRLAVDRLLIEEMSIRDQMAVKTLEVDLLNLSLLESEYRMDAERHILAPRDGVVASVRVGIGDTVKYGQVLLDIVPVNASSLDAKLYVSSSAAAQLHEGDVVKLQVTGFPIESFGDVIGSVRSVSSTALTPEAAPVLIGTGDPMFELDVEFPNGIHMNSFDETIQLRPGMPVTADLILRKETVLDWLIKPLRRAAKRI